MDDGGDCDERAGDRITALQSARGGHPFHATVVAAEAVPGDSIAAPSVRLTLDVLGAGKARFRFDPDTLAAVAGRRPESPLSAHG